MHQIVSFYIVKHLRVLRILFGIRRCTNDCIIIINRKLVCPQCDNIMSTYGPAIIQLIAQYADPEEICKVRLSLSPQDALLSQWLGLPEG